MSKKFIKKVNERPGHEKLYASAVDKWFGNSKENEAVIKTHRAGSKEGHNTSVYGTLSSEESSIIDTSRSRSST